MEPTMTKAEIAKAKKAERNAKAYEANKQKIAEQNAQKKDEISLKNKEAYEKNKEVIADKYQKNKEVIKKAREEKIEGMSWKEVDEFKEKKCEYAREYYEKNKDMIIEKKEQREIAKALEQEPRKQKYRAESIRLYKLDPLLHPHNPETDLSEPTKTRVHKPKNNEENKIISVIQLIERETYEPTPIKKSHVKVNVKIKPTPPLKPPQQPIPVLPIATETASGPVILKYKLGEYYDEDDEFIYFEEISEEDVFSMKLDEIKKIEYKKHMLNYNKYIVNEIEREMYST